MNRHQQFQRIEDDYPGLLNEQQLVALARLQQGVKELAEDVARLNALKVDTRLPLPSICMAAYEAGTLLYAIDSLVFEHELADARLRRDACATPLREAA